MNTNLQNYILTVAVAVYTYFYVGFDFLDYVIFLIIAAVITILIVAFSKGDKIAYAKFEEPEGGLAKTVDINVPTLKYLAYSLPVLAVIVGFVFMVMFTVDYSEGTNRYSLSNFHLEISGLLINFLPLILNIFINKNKKGWLTNLKNKYFFVLATCIFIPFVVPTEFLKVVVVSLVFAYTTNAQIAHKPAEIRNNI